MTIIDEMPVRDPVVVEGDPADLADCKVFIVAVPTAAPASRLLAALPTTTGPIGRQIGLFEFGDRLTRRARLRPEGQNAFRNKHLLGCAIDTAAQHGVEPGRFALPCRSVAQGNMLQLAGVGINDEKVLGIRQMRFDA